MWHCRIAAAGPPYNITVSCYTTENDRKNKASFLTT